jgi:hypothetical protein
VEKIWDREFLAARQHNLEPLIDALRSKKPSSYVLGRLADFLSEIKKFTFKPPATQPKASASVARMHKHWRSKGGKGGREAFVTHDLRRTARSLMSRANINSEIAERMIGHLPSGMIKRYDRHDFLKEKREGFVKLEREVEMILNPPQADVIPYRPR